LHKMAFKDYSLGGELQSSVPLLVLFGMLFTFKNEVVCNAVAVTRYYFRKVIVQHCPEPTLYHIFSYQKTLVSAHGCMTEDLVRR